MNATDQTVAPVAAPTAVAKKSAGDLAIDASIKTGGTAVQLRKALWSVRGDVCVKVEGVSAPMAVVKAQIVEQLEILIAKNEKAAAPFMLEKAKDPKAGWILKAVAKK